MKTKYLFLTIALMISLSLFKAQSKYEFMTIAYYEFSMEINISINGKDYVTVEAKKKMDDKATQGNNPLLKKVEEYQDLDWELINFNTEMSGTTTEAFYAYMRKKKADKK